MGIFSEIFGLLFSMALQNSDEATRQVYEDRKQRYEAAKAKKAYEIQLAEYEAAYSAAKENGDDEKVWELGPDIAKLEKAISEIEDYLDTYTDEEE